MAPDTYALILQAGFDNWLARHEADVPGEELDEFRSIITATEHLPPRVTRDPEQIAVRAREKEVVKRRLAALVDRGMTPVQALRAATVTSAELIQRDDELGRLEAGYLADVIAVGGNPAEDITATQDVRFVMKDGRIHLQP